MEKLLRDNELGYNSFPVSLKYFFASPNFNTIDDPNFLVYFKLLLKKDINTKEKALKGLYDSLLNNNNNLTFNNDVIVFWIQLFPKLTIENSKIIRITSHQIQGLFLKFFGQKKYAKYLKSTIPSWISGLFDIDKQVVLSTKKIFYDCFRDENKIDKIWVIFLDQIVNYIYICIQIESYESISDKRHMNDFDIIMKYKRLLFVSTSMILKLINYVNNGTVSLENSTESKKKITSILYSENFWIFSKSKGDLDFLSISYIKLLFSLIEIIFTKNNDNTLNLFLSNIEVEKFYEFISKMFIKNVNLNVILINKFPSLIYSELIIQFWNCLIILTEFTNNKSSFKNNKIIQNFWHYTDNKAPSLLIGYLKTIKFNKSTIFFRKLSDFFQCFNSEYFQNKAQINCIEFENYIFANQIFDEICLPEIKNIKIVNDFYFFLKFMFEIISLFDYHKSNFFYKTIKIILFETLDFISKDNYENNSQQIFEILNEISFFLKKNYKKENYDFVSNQFEILLTKIFDENSYQTLTLNEFKFKSNPLIIINNYLELLKLLDHEKKDEFYIFQIMDRIDDTKEIDLTLSFNILINFIKNQKIITSEKFIIFLKKNHLHIKNDFIDIPLKLLFESRKNIKINNFDLEEIITQHFTKLFELKSTLLINFLDIFKNDIIVFKDKEIYKKICFYISEKLKSNNYSNEELIFFFNFIFDSSVLKMLIKNLVNCKIKCFKFAIYLVDNNQVNFFNEKLVQEYGYIFFYNLWNYYDDEKIQVFFKLLKSYEKIIFDSLFEFIIFNDMNYDYSSIIINFETNVFPVESFLKKTHFFNNSIPSLLLTIENFLGTNCLLFEIENEFSLNHSIKSIGYFILQLLKLSKKNSNYFIYSSIIAEYIEDFLVLNKKNNKNNDQIVNLKIELSNIFLSLFKDFKTDNIVNFDYTNDDVNNNIAYEILFLLNKKLNESENLYYYSKVYKRIIDYLFKHELLKKIDFDLKFDDSNSETLKSCIYLSFGYNAFEKKNISRHCDFVLSQFFFSDSINDLIKCTKWITIFLNFYNETYPLEIIRDYKFNVFLNKLISWTNFFDNNVVPIKLRLQITIFFYFYMLKNTNMSENVKTFIIKLISNNFSNITNSMSLPLKYFNLKLFNIMIDFEQKNQQKMNSQVVDLFQFLIEDLLNNNNQEQELNYDNHFTELIQNLRCVIIEKYEMQFDYLNQIKKKLYLTLFNNNFINNKRFVTILLMNLIHDNQNNLVVEYQLQKANLGDDTNSDLKLELEPLLINEINFFNFELDEKNSKSIFTYLWSWYLIFMHLDCVNFSIKSQFIKTLKKDNSVDIFLSFIFNIIDYVNVEKHIIKKNYEIKSFKNESIDLEKNVLVLHLLYLSANHLGSFLQDWFKKITDKQLKIEINNFFIKLVSPAVIEKILNQVLKKKNDLTDKNVALLLNKNSIGNEIKYLFYIDDSSLEMIIKIPNNYPFENIIIDGKSSINVKNKQWKAWILASQCVMNSLNGNIIDSIELFSKNVAYHFSGFENCFICYSILHLDHSLPLKKCQTCSNKFHSACLYKWFKSSNASTCPLCRSAFNFRNIKR